MGRGGRRSVRRALLAAAGTCAILSVALPARAQGGAPTIWHSAASAQAASFDVAQTVLPISGIFNLIALQGAGTYETDNQTAVASVLYPGNGVIQGPNLACGTFGSSFPAQFAPILDACTKFDYPLTVRADASTPDASTVGSLQAGKATDPISADAIGAKAHAASDSSTTAAELANLNVLGLPGIDPIPLLPIQQLKLDPTVVGIANASSTTDQRITGGQLVAQANTVLSGINLVGGLIHIGSIHSTSKITDDGNGKRTSNASLEVGGVTVAGVPAEITNNGIVLDTSTTSLGPLTTQLSHAVEQLLSGLGVKLTLLDKETTTDDGHGQAVASAAGLLLEIRLNVAGLPAIPGPLGNMDLNGSYVGSVQLGYTGASGAASTFTNDVTAPTEQVSTPPDLGSSGGSSFGGTTGLSLGSIPSVSISPPAIAAPKGRTLVRSLGDPFDDRLGLLYLAFAFAVLGLCIVPRLTLPARLPGPRS